ncbi:related to 3',5'-cyclic-nucleotide phosphodiesterase 2 [Zygosaccharomyces bailii ISA1307]|nr:related to 3',5'-cyclic-nucleotide phosphodiesterase 2 [Zygosaccharomyces bailii ISA1307]
MSTLFLVGVPKSTLKTTLEEKFPQLFDRTLAVDDVDELLLWLYRERVGSYSSNRISAGAAEPPTTSPTLTSASASMADVTPPVQDDTAAAGAEAGVVEPATGDWSFETGITLIIYKSQEGAYRELSPLLQHFFPCFNMLAVPESQLGEIEPLLTQLQGYSQLCHDRIARMAHWMYRREPSAGFYQMLQHLRCASLQQQNVIPRAIRSIDFASLLGITPYHEKRLWRTLDSWAFQPHSLQMLQHLRCASLQQQNVIPRAIRSIDFASLLGITPYHEKRLWRTLDSWAFQPHSLQTSELVVCSFLLLRQCARDAKIIAQENRLLLLLFTLEASYHQINRFHNFRHAVDVMQAAWQLAKRLLQDPLQTLLVTLAALGHDVGHPGSNNQLLCKYSSPVAIHYREKSVLEHLHTDLFGALLSEHWPQLIGRSVQGRENMELIAEAIMATDMALHGDYVRQLQVSTQLADPRSLSSLILKAADISNVTRPLDVSAQWAALITLEFEDCALLDHYETASEEERKDTESENSSGQEHGIDSTFDFSKASPEQLTSKLPNIPAGQIFFIDTFAEQFFAEFCKRFPAVEFLVENVKANRESWVNKSKNLPIIPPF